MFHILGRLAFSLSLSRRSRSGLSAGSNRFGSFFCERGPLNVFIIPTNPSIIRNLKPLSRLLVRPISAPIRVIPWRCSASPSYGSVLVQSHALGARRLTRVRHARFLGLDRKLSNRLLIELDMGLQPTFPTIYCGGDRYRTHSRAVFGGGALSRRTRPASGCGSAGVCR